MRDTAYAKELASASVSAGNSELRIERLYVKKEEHVEIRFSWWKRGKFMPRPLDLTEKTLLALIKKAPRKKAGETVFSPRFVKGLRAAISENSHARR